MKHALDKSGVASIRAPQKRVKQTLGPGVQTTLKKFVTAITGALDKALTQWKHHHQSDALEKKLSPLTREVPEKKKEHRNCPVRSTGYRIFFGEVPEKNIEDQTALELSDEGH